MTILACKEPECQRKVQARGMCSTHYSYWHRANNGGRVYTTYTRPCAFCATPFTTTTKATAHCSLVCAQRSLAGWSTCKDLVPIAKPKAWAGHTIPPRKGLALVSGPCPYCGTNFTAGPGASYCSDRCKANAKMKRKYDLRGQFKVSDLTRQAIYKRDKNTCKLCNERVDTTLHYTHAMSATLDHIIPQSWMLIPDHSESNLRLAHRSCNSARGASAA